MGALSTQDSSHSVMKLESNSYRKGIGSFKNDNSFGIIILVTFVVLLISLSVMTIIVFLILLLITITNEIISNI